MKKQGDCKKLSWNLRMLYYWGKFVGVVSLTLSENSELKFSYLSLFYGCFLSASYGSVIYHVLIKRLLMMMPTEPAIVIILEFIATICVFFENSCTWLVVAFCQNRMKLIVRSFVKIEKISRKLDIKENYEKLYEKLGSQVILVNLLYLAFISVNVMALRNSPNFEWLIWIFYSVPRVASFNMVIIFHWSLAGVQKKFHCLNETVRSLEMQNYRDDSSEVDEEAIAGLLRTGLNADRIKYICQLHRELRNLIFRITQHFALFFLFMIATQFSDMTINVYMIHRFAKIFSLERGMTYVYLTAVATWAFMPLAMLAVITKICGSTTCEANKTGIILHEMLNDSDILHDRRKAAKLYVLSLDLLQNPTRITLFGFFEMDSFLLFRSIATATTYLIIILQFHR